MNGHLVDDQQFPRNDIDIPTVRCARHRVTCEYSLFIFLELNNLISFKMTYIYYYYSKFHI